jgi:hypothetical protein
MGGADSLGSIGFFVRFQFSSHVYVSHFGIDRWVYRFLPVAAGMLSLLPIAIRSEAELGLDRIFE